MIAHKYYSPDGDGGGTSAPGTGTAETGAAEAAAGAESGGEAGQPDSAAATQAATEATPDFRGMHERALKGEQVPDEHLDAYERWVASGMPEAEAATEEQQQPADEPKPAEMPEWQANLMKDCGAKTPDEIYGKFQGLRKELSLKGAAISGFSRLMEECKAGSQIAIHRFREIYGFNPGAASSTAPAAPTTAPVPAQTAPTPPAAQNGYNKDMFFDPDEGDRFLGEFGRLKAELAAIRENFGTIEQKARQREIELDNAKFQSVFTDEICEVAELFREDFGLGNVPMRSAIEQLITTGSLGEKDVLKPFADYLVLYAGRKPEHTGLSLKEYYKLLNFDKVGGKIAQARMEAGKAATSRTAGAKPTVGVAAVAQHKAIAPNPSDKELEAYRDGNMDMPEEWFDDEGDPTEKMPQKLKLMLGYQAA